MTIQYHSITRLGLVGLAIISVTSLSACNHYQARHASVYQPEPVHHQEPVFYQQPVHHEDRLSYDNHDNPYGQGFNNDPAAQFIDQMSHLIGGY